MQKMKIKTIIVMPKDTIHKGVLAGSPGRVLGTRPSLTSPTVEKTEETTSNVPLWIKARISIKESAISSSIRDPSLIFISLPPIL